MSKNWSGGSTKAWRKIRAGVLARDNYYCQVGLPGICEGKATHVHHTLGRGVTGDDPRYLVASCAACNQAIGDPQKAKHKPKRMTKW